MIKTEICFKANTALVTELDANKDVGSQTGFGTSQQVMS